MRFRILGPLEVEAEDGRAITVRAPQERALLLRLLLDANRTLSVPGLIEDLWGEGAPRTAVRTLRVYVSRLRHALGEIDRIRTTPGGYMLTLAAEESDVARFESLLEQARPLLDDLQAAEPGGPAAQRRQAERLLTEALSLWRGTPLADVADAPWARPDVARLEERRLTALEDRIDLDLGAGRHVGVIAELEALCARAPLRERFWAARMIALYRCGRPADALACFSELRAHLVEELGLEPSPELRDLQRRVLGEDPTLHLSPDSAGPDPDLAETRVKAAVGSLPAASTPFLGRARELGEVAGLLWRTETRLVTLTGAGGSGKTRLAHRVAELAAQDYPDGAWFVGFSDITDPDLIASTICRTVGIAEQPNIAPVDRLAAWCGERSVLLLLDNLEQLTAGTAILGELLSRCRRVTLLVTSREPLRLAGEQQYEVPVLDRDEAVELFSARARAVRPHLTVDARIAAAICERVDRLPLAIELAAARMRTLLPAELLTRLEQRLLVLASGPRDAPRRQQTLRATIDWSYELLTDSEQRLFDRLAVFSGGFTLSAAEAVCDADLDALATLVDRSLIRVDDRGRYAMLQTLQEYALAHLVRAGEIDAVRRRHARWYLELLEPQVVIDFSPRAAVIVRRAVGELDNLRAAVEWAAANEPVTAGWLVQVVASTVWWRQGLLGEAERWIGAVRRHQAEYPPELRAHLLGSAARFAWKRGAFAEASDLCEQALAIYRAIDHAEGLCGQLNGRGIYAAEQDDLVTARATLEELVAYARTEGLTGVVPWALCNLAGVAAEEGNLSEARAVCEEGLALSQSLGITEVTAGLLIMLTNIANLQGRHGEALRHGQQTITVALENEDRLTAAIAVMEIAWALSEQGESHRAARLLGAGIGFHATAEADTDRICGDKTLENLRADLDEPTLQALLDEGRAITFDAAVEDALSTSRIAGPASTT